jgi:hypothetical protein
MHDTNVDAVARYPRIFTVNPFTLLMDHNRFWLSEPFSTKAGAPTPTRHSAPGHCAEEYVRLRDRSVERERPGSGCRRGNDQGRRSLRNFSRNRPETTNLNHQ